MESVVDLSVLRDPSPYGVAISGGLRPWEVSSGKLQEGLARISAIYRELRMADKGSDCQSIALSVEQRIKLDVAKVLEIVESEVSSNPACACEIVKVAIRTIDADVFLVAAIVEASIRAAPDSMRLVSQCAIAEMPESIAQVQALLTKLDPNSGEDGYVGAKGAKVAAAVIQKSPPNPLDLPPSSSPKPPIIPPHVTEVNPRLRR